MIFRLGLIGVGIVVILMGHTEYELLEKSSAEPVAVELAELEAGQELPNIHIQLGHHWKVWDELIYSYRLKKGQSEDDPAAKVSYAYYPLVSSSHPHSIAFDQIEATYANMADVPGDAWPTLQKFKILVRTEEFKTVGGLRKDLTWTDANELTGLVVNDVRHLGSGERGLLKESYPGLRLDEVLIVEEGRRPKSLASCLMWMGGGGALVLLGLYLVFSAATGRKKEAGDAPPVITSAEAMG
jgi:hypothetical protein